MVPSVSMVLLIVAAICFALGTVGLPANINTLPAGLFFLTLAFIFGRLGP
jgi:hypothetical protein